MDSCGDASNQTVISDLTSSMSTSTVVDPADDSSSTVTGPRSHSKRKKHNYEETQLLAASAQITEASYSVSDIHSRIFEIQELRHQDLGSNSINGSSSTLSTIIDQALVRLDERLEAVAQNITLITTYLEPLSEVALSVPTHSVDSNTALILLRKHGALLSEWDSVQREAEILRDELKEDKWLLVFRTASDQADGMMNSLDRIIDQCNAYLADASATEANLASFAELQNSLEAKKKYYVPSVSKVLSVLDKGVRDRVTKNGECLRRHADMRLRWRSLKENLARVDISMSKAKSILVESESLAGEEESSVSHISLDGHTSEKQKPNTSSATPIRHPWNGTPPLNAPSSEPVLRHRASSTQLRVSQTSRELSHRHTSSAQLTPLDTHTNNLSTKPPWNSSPRPIPSRPPTSSRVSSQGMTPVSQIQTSSRSVSSWSQPGPRSASRMSQARSQVSVNDSYFDPRPLSRQNRSRSESRVGNGRPKSPTRIPAPNFYRLPSSRVVNDIEDEASISLMSRALTPSGISSTPLPTPHVTPDRGKNRRQSLLPIPTGTIKSPPSRPHSRAPSPSPTSYSSFSTSTLDNAAITGRTLPSRTPSRTAGRLVPPSSYRDSVSPLPPPIPPRSVLRPGQSHTSALDQEPLQIYEYIPGNLKDPLDVQIAEVVNSVLHGFVIERVDPHSRKSLPPGEEHKAQYSFSNAYGKKTLSCKLLVINRAAPKTLAGHVQKKKVMCRIGGGWQDLESFLMTHGKV